MVFHWSLSDSKSPQVSRTLLSILVYLNNAVALQSLFESFDDCTKSINYKWNNRHFRVQPPSKVVVLISLFTFFQLYSVVRLDSKVYNPASSHFYANYCKVWSSGWDYPFVSQNPRGVCVFPSPGQILSGAYTICLYSQTSISRTIPSGSPWHPVAPSFILVQY